MRILYYRADYRRPRALEMPNSVQSFEDLLDMLFIPSPYLDVHTFAPPYDMFSIITPAKSEEETGIENLAFKFLNFDYCFEGDAVIARNDGNFDVPESFTPLKPHPYSVYEAMSMPDLLRDNIIVNTGEYE